MPSKKSAFKELKKSKKRQEQNSSLKKAFKKEEKKIAALIANENISKLKSEINAFISKIDKAVTKKLLHKNTAARKKSHILKQLHSLSTNKSSE